MSTRLYVGDDKACICTDACYASVMECPDEKPGKKPGKKSPPPPKKAGGIKPGPKTGGSVYTPPPSTGNGSTAPVTPVNNSDAPPIKTPPPADTTVVTTTKDPKQPTDGNGVIEPPPIEIPPKERKKKGKSFLSKAWEVYQNIPFALSGKVWTNPRATFPSLRDRFQRPGSMVDVWGAEVNLHLLIPVTDFLLIEPYGGFGYLSRDKYPLEIDPTGPSYQPQNWTTYVGVVGLRTVFQTGSFYESLDLSGGPIVEDSKGFFRLCLGLGALGARWGKGQLGVEGCYQGDTDADRRGSIEVRAQF